MKPRSSDWVAHACSVLVSALCRNSLSKKPKLRTQEKFAIAKCDHQHAESVRSPENS
jgi:hypothetical protein